MIRAAAALAALALALTPGVATPEDPVSHVRAVIAQAALRHGVPSWYLDAVARCETGGTYDPTLVGRAGETGLFQWHPRGRWWGTSHGLAGMPRPNGWATIWWDADGAAESFAEGFGYQWSCA